VALRINDLAEEVFRDMFLHQLKAGFMLIAILGILLAGGGMAVGLYARAGTGAEPPGAGQVAAAPAAGGGEQAGDSPAAPSRPVTVRRPLRREAAPYMDCMGRLEARRAVEVRPAVSGVVQKVCFKAGDEVRKGDVLFELDPRLFQLAREKARTELAAAEARRQQCEAERKRFQRLVEQGTAERELLDKATERVAAAEAAVQAARLDVTRAELDLEAAAVRAPMSGQVGEPQVEPGTLVFRGQDRATLLTTVRTLDPIGLNFCVDESSFLRYRRLLGDRRGKGPGGSLRMGMADEDGFPHEGTLESFEDHVDPGTGTVRVRGSFPNPGRLFLPGMMARVRLTVGPPRAVLLVPEEAIHSDQGVKFVLVVNDRKVAERRDVTLGPVEDGLRIVEKGLRGEDRVVVAGQKGVRPGDRVEPREAAVPDRPGWDR
jgi:RND family efflux transporter MFP subunit